jgi:hypothetical protein
MGPRVREGTEGFQEPPGPERQKQDHRPACPHRCHSQIPACCLCAACARGDAGRSPELGFWAEAGRVPQVVAGHPGTSPRGTHARTVTPPEPPGDQDGSVGDTGGTGRGHFIHSPGVGGGRVPE